MTGFSEIILVAALSSTYAHLPRQMSVSSSFAPPALVRNINEIENPVSYSYKAEAIRLSPREQALSLFGEMRDLDERQMKLYKDMLSRVSTDTGVNWLSLGDASDGETIDTGFNLLTFKA